MALSGSFTGSTSNKYVQPKIVWSATQSIDGNYSDVTATLYYSRTNSGYTTSGTWSGGITINGTRTSGSKQISITQNSNTVALTATTRVYHNADGSKSIVISADGTIPAPTNLTSTSCSATVTLNQIPRQASIGIFTNGSVYDYFTDEDNPTVYFYNPAGNAVTVQTCISWTGGADIAYRNVNRTSDHYTFYLTEEERNKLRAATTKGSTKRSVTIYITTIIGSQTYYSTKMVTFEVINCALEWNPTVIDEGSMSTKLTGNPNTMIRGYNCIKATFNATVKKGASIVERTVTCGKKTLYNDGNFGDGVSDFLYDNVFTFKLKDNRGHSLEKTITMPAIDYVAVTCNTKYDTEILSDNLADINVTLSGNCFKGSFGAENNTLTVEYRYQKNNEGFPVDDEGHEVWTTSVGALIENTKYEISFDIKNIDYKDTYTIQARAKDAVYPNGIYAKEQIVKIVPVFDWGENDFNFNVPVTIQGNPVRAFDADGRIARAYTQEEVSYEGYTYINLYRSGSPTDLYNQKIATFNTDGTIKINKDMIALINIHIPSYNNGDNKRSWVKFLNYDTGWQYTASINYGQWTTTCINIVLNLTKDTVLGIQAAEPMTINSGGPAGSYIEILEI